MSKILDGSITGCFADLPDPRMAKKVRHKLSDIIAITLCGVVCGANDWVSIQKYGKCKKDWFQTFLELPNGIPSHDTFGRVFALLSTEALEKHFIDWVNSIAQKIEGVVAIDGKQLRRSYDTRSDKAAIHMVSAWASNTGLVLGQVKTEEKSNEITAIPALLELLELKGCIVTLDAMGCQKKIVEKIVEKEADYVISLKGNQSKLHDEVYEFFQQSHETNFDGLTMQYHETEEKNHGRVEIRRYWIVDIPPDQFPQAGDWKNLRTIGIVETERHTKEKENREFRLYISSLECNATLFASAVRNHWGIENSLHWVLDVAFREDECRVRKDNAPQNLAIIRHFAQNLLKNEKSGKGGCQYKTANSGLG